jgi:drug/metabolite transporter (DMT)-like permease
LSRQTNGRARTIIFTGLALIAFAANSVFCRRALQQQAIDPATFSTIRFASGATVLLAITGMRTRSHTSSGSWGAAAILAFYAIPFAFAYVLLTAGTGALILFGTVQVTMLGAALLGGERINSWQVIGLAVALVGLVYLVWPGLAAPSPIGAVLMALAGVGWGLYSLRGRGAIDPVQQTTSNFVRAVPLILLASLASVAEFHISASGAALAAASGVLATGLGYVAWFAALPGLTAVKASIVQLAVPVIAGIGGVVLLSEPVQGRLIGASILVLGGIALAILSRGMKGRGRERSEIT